MLIKPCTLHLHCGALEYVPPGLALARRPYGSDYEVALLQDLVHLQEDEASMIIPQGLNTAAAQEMYTG